VEGARAYCGRRPDVAAVLLPQGDDARPVALNLGKDEVDIVNPQ